MSERRRQSPNVVRLGDRVWVTPDGHRSGGLMGTISSFDGPRVFVLLDGFTEPRPFRFDQVS